jgi:hypothetical protein
MFKPLKIKNGTFSILLGQIPLTFLNDTPTECAILNVQRYKKLRILFINNIFTKKSKSWNNQGEKRRVCHNTTLLLIHFIFISLKVDKVKLK